MVCSFAGVEFFLGGLVGFVLLDRNLKLADCSSTNVVTRPAKGKKNWQYNDQNSQIHRD